MCMVVRDRGDDELDLPPARHFAIFTRMDAGSIRRSTQGSVKESTQRRRKGE